MEGEMRNFAMVWTVVAALIYCIFLGGPTSFFVSWLATFKLLLFSFSLGPLSLPDLSFHRFLALACFPIQINGASPVGAEPEKAKKKKSAINYAIKTVIFATAIPAYLNKSAIHPQAFLLLYAIYTYVSLEFILSTITAATHTFLGIELEPQFDEPYLATSLQDFWGRRWNLAATRVLRPVVYVPVRKITERLIGRRWAPVPAVVAAFLVSGAMHELVMYNIGRVRPDGAVTTFFVLHGVCVAAEVVAKKAAEDNGVTGIPAVMWGLTTVGFVVVTAVLLFFPALVTRCQADAMAHREIVAFVEFVKGLASHRWHI